MLLCTLLSKLATSFLKPSAWMAAKVIVAAKCALLNIPLTLATPGAYYFLPAASPSSSTKWRLFFEGNPISLSSQFDHVSPHPLPSFPQVGAGATTSLSYYCPSALTIEPGACLMTTASPAAAPSSAPQTVSPNFPAALLDLTDHRLAAHFIQPQWLLRLLLS